MADDFSQTLENFKKNVIEQNRIESKYSSGSIYSRQNNKPKHTERMNIFALAKTSKSEGKIRKKIRNRIDLNNKYQKGNINEYLDKKFDQITFKKKLELTEFEKTKNIVKLKDRELLFNEYFSFLNTDPNLYSKNSLFDIIKFSKKIFNVKDKDNKKSLIGNTHKYYNSNFINYSSRMKNKKDNYTQIYPYSIFDLNIKKIKKGKKRLIGLKIFNRNSKHYPTFIIKNDISNNDNSKNNNEFSTSKIKNNINLNLHIRSKKRAVTKITKKHKDLYNEDLTYNNVFPKIILKK